MGITNSKAPQKQSWSGNPIPVQLFSNDFLLEAGVTAQSIITFTSGTLDNTTMRLLWSAGDVTFTFVPAPDDSGEQLPSGDGSPAHVAGIMEWLSYNYYLERDFYIVQLASGITPNSSIRITAKLPGVNYNITDTILVPSAPGTTIDPNFAITSTEGVNRLRKPGFMQMLQVWKKAMTDVLLNDRPLILDSPETGISTKNIAEILHPQLDYDIPDLTTIWQPCIKSFMEYYLRYAQIFGDTPKPKRAFTTGSYFVYLGGYSEMAMGVITRADQLGFSLLPSNLLFRFQRWFESYERDNFVIKNNQPAFLYFVNNRDIPETLDIKITLQFDTVAPQSIIKTGGLLNAFNKVCINCSYKALGLSAYTDTVKKVIGYTVQMVEHGTNDPRSLVKTFIVDRSEERYTRYILFGDSAGNFKSLHLSGESSPATEFADSQANSFPDENTPKIGNIKRFNVKAVKKDAVSTGFITAQSLDDLEEISFSQPAFRVFDNTMVPIIILTKEFIPSLDGQNLNACKIEYQYAVQEERYTGTSNTLKVPAFNTVQTALNSI